MQRRRTTRNTPNVGQSRASHIFPQSSPEFEAALLKLIRNGEDTDREFVLSVLQNYQGEPFVRRL
jgi:hypothetical protein